MEISVIIPTHGGLQRIPDTLRRLSFHGRWELIVAGDGLSPEDVSFLRSQGVRLCTSRRRRGKVVALNEAVGLSSGELLVFIDADTVPEEGFLEKVWAAYREKGFDMAAVKLGVSGRSFLERVVDVEYMFINLEMALGNLIKQPVPTIGAVIIMTRQLFDRLGGFRRTIVEDLDIGIRANVAGARFCYLKNVHAETAAPSSLKGWFVQRKRWMRGGQESLFKENTRSVLKKFPISFAAFSAYNPMLSAFLTSLLLATLLLSGISFLIVAGLTLGITSGVAVFANRVLSWGLSLPRFLSYLFLYGPLLSAFSLFSVVYFTFRKEKLEDWVV